MASRTYDSPAAFKQALEQRLRAASTSGVDFSRRRQLLVFDRFLARVACTMGEAAVLKGGLVLELRLTRARTTKDVDLRFSGSPAVILDRLQAAGRLAGRLYGQPFAVDVAFGDPIVGMPEFLTTPDLLAFAGIAAPTVPVYPIESHIAEKLHAYTMPRRRDNTRVKDLPDLALLGTIRELDGDRLREALDRTFTFRGTHAVPPSLPEPPDAWADVYRRMALEDGLEWRATCLRSSRLSEASSIPSSATPRICAGRRPCGAGNRFAPGRHERMQRTSTCAGASRVTFSANDCFSSVWNSRDSVARIGQNRKKSHVARSRQRTRRSVTRPSCAWRGTAEVRARQAPKKPSGSQPGGGQPARKPELG